MVFIGTKAKLVCSRTTLLSPAAVSRGCIPPQQIVELAEFFLVCPWACFLLAETFQKPYANTFTDPMDFRVTSRLSMSNEQSMEKKNGVIWTVY